MANEEQAGHWNSAEASHWVTHQLRYDTMLAPFGDRVLAAAQVAGPDRVLDVGCGCGATTLEAGRRAATGTATGLDLFGIHAGRRSRPGRRGAAGQRIVRGRRRPDIPVPGWRFRRGSLRITSVFMVITLVRRLRAGQPALHAGSFHSHDQANHSSSMFY